MQLYNDVVVYVVNSTSNNSIYKLLHIYNKAPAEQRDIFRTNCSSNDIFLRLKSSHCTMKTHGWWKKVGRFLNQVIPFQKETLQEHIKHLFAFFVGLCVYQNLTNQFFIISRELDKIGKIWKILLYRQFCGQFKNFSVDCGQLKKL